jgi:hypothetical protein
MNYDLLQSYYLVTDTDEDTLDPKARWQVAHYEPAWWQDTRGGICYLDRDTSISELSWDLLTARDVDVPNRVPWLTEPEACKYTGLTRAQLEGACRYKRRNQFKKQAWYYPLDALRKYVKALLRAPF